MSDRSYSISELAAEFGVSTRTIRFYEEKGYLSPRREGQRRVYSAADRARIRLILRGKRIGLSLAESVEIIDLYHSHGSDAEQRSLLLEKIEERRQTLKQQQRDLRAMLGALDEVEALCRDATGQTGPETATLAGANKQQTQG
ncbi:MAG: MerR family DNA-binding transcriptional regulator [Halieaceae bacterium]|jgi:DNA-binding transcriptional MerR regulator|nr:MerR family DNA-binding transcriptional regulator [Halieaceae bacterium]